MDIHGWPEPATPNELGLWLELLGGPTRRPWWRHWHVADKPFGYTLSEAKEVARDYNAYWSENHNPYWGAYVPVEPVRCDVDHSSE
jgi:hypothetical protein